MGGEHGGVGGTITLSEASRFGSSTAFSLMLKPVGSRCNLRCSYCYYLDKSCIYGGREPLMSLALLERCIRDFCESCDLPELTIEWHGGEPLLAGMDFFRSALAFERKYSRGRPVHNTLQTNGTLLNAEWASFFHDNNFLIGLSLDGPEDVHDRFRHTVSGGGTFRSVMHGLEALHRGRVEFNTLTTISKAGEDRGADVYRFLKSAGSRYMQFMPVYEYLSAGHIAPSSDMEAVIAPWSVEPEAFGRYLCDVFDEWVKENVGRYFVLTFDAALSSWCGVQPGICTFCESCGGNLTVEHNGDIYPCDHFVYPQWRLGNIQDISLREASTSQRLAAFGTAKRNLLPETCLRCPWRHACNGGCPKHRPPHDVSALCSGYTAFYSHVAPCMEKMRSLLLSGRAPSEICLSENRNSL
ncbi:MAG TPA: anaerobic sulfatase maturase [Candidatus Coprenecus stercoravium]|uniref:Anaerobic sulfatase maturase n=1 Tax=Candidatus Coprenecus stercoravium TaxID=2840735 RepID=A0A9D2GP19_9BACT|nr:anaerobic sulfatase maturase [Candidatus Coprenecus stercoravium]